MARKFASASTQYIYTNAPVTKAPFTVSCWVRTRAGAINKAIWSLGDASGPNHYFMCYLASDTNTYYTAGEGGSFGQTPAGRLWSAEVWSHVVCIEASSTNRRLYFNNRDSGTNTTNITPTGIDRLAIGIRCDNNTSPMNGDVVDFFVWNVALSVFEIELIYKGVWPGAIRPDKMVMNAPLRGTDEDYIGGKHFTPVASPTWTNNPIRLSYKDSPMVETRDPRRKNKSGKPRGKPPKVPPQPPPPPSGLFVIMDTA